MPHKHTRGRLSDERDHNLAPSQLAKSLPAFSGKAAPKSRDKGSKKSGNVRDEKSKRTTKAKTRSTIPGYGVDDTPRAFARLQAWQTGKRPATGPDNGESARKAKKRRLEEENADSGNQIEKQKDEDKQLRILPGESLADFSTRVNQALPLGSVSQKGKKVEGIKERQTRTEKRLHRMYAEWRVEDAKIKEKLEEEQEQAEEEAEERAAQFGGQDIAFPPSRRGKKKRMLGEIADGADDDPWAVLKTKRVTQPPSETVRSGKLQGVNDVVQAPPSFNVIPKEKFKVRNGAQVDVANVPSGAGSLKRREELGQARKEVIERYRAMMKSSS